MDHRSAARSGAQFHQICHGDMKVVMPDNVLIHNSILHVFQVFILISTLWLHTRGTAGGPAVHHNGAKGKEAITINIGGSDIVIPDFGALKKRRQKTHEETKKRWHLHLSVDMSVDTYL